MRAFLRLGITVAAASLWLGETPAHAQSAPAPTTNAPAADSIGPRELQNFSLSGTVTRPADQPSAPRNTRAATQAPTSADATDTTVASGAGAPAERPSRPVRVAQQRAAPAGALAPPPPPTTPPAGDPASAPVAPASLPAVADTPPTTLAPEHSMPLWPWLLAALVLGAGGAFLFWRRGLREAYAGGPRIDAFVAPEPQPTPPVPPPAAPPPALKPVGIVSTRMRPWIEVGFKPLRCIVAEQAITFEFELELFNSGNAAARDILVQAAVFNAGPAQDQEIQAFFSAGRLGERTTDIPPLQRLTLRPQLAISLDQVRMLEAGGRRVFVPLIGLKAAYGWGGGAGQTAAAWLIGRETKSEKLAPFRLDLGPRIFRGLGARALPDSVRD